MTKGQVYKRYGLSLANVNFNPDEVADEKFIKACDAFYTTYIRDYVKEKLDDLRERVVKNYGEEVANKIECDALLDCCRLQGMPDDLIGFIKILIANGCPANAIVEGLDYLDTLGGTDK